MNLLSMASLHEMPSLAPKENAMMFDITVTGRRLSDNGNYELHVLREAPTERAALEQLDQDYDWEDAATRSVSAVPAH